ncbi:MAG: GNAT family N-acetyltransferase [Verrucomicrobia bacterium]|nr:GNAT family N-acetyltransferase [Verrucomicrobiota bacterium]MBV9644685.1 GNAT family N-acetyltransferase [Verrucomicrobiota bacterium]
MKAVPVTIEWHSGLPIYSSEPFLKSVSAEYGWIGGLDTLGNLRCVLPYVSLRKSIFHLIRFATEPIPTKADLSLEEENAFLNSAMEHFRLAGVDLIIPATFNTLFRTYPAGATAAEYGTYLIDLTQPEQTHWQNLHSKHRNVIRNALKKGVRVRSGPEYLDTAYGLVRDSFERSSVGFVSRLRLNLRMSYESFRNQVDSLGDNVRIFVAEFEGKVQGCAVIHFSEHTAYYMHGGSVPVPVTGALNLLHWEAIRHFREAGVRHYNFVGARPNPRPGSKQEGIIRFKERFGGKLVRGYMWKYSFHPLKSSLYNLAAHLRNGGDIVDQLLRDLKDAQRCSSAGGTVQSNPL